MAGSSSLIMGVNSVGQGIMGAQAQATQGEYQRRTAEMNARLADIQATDALGRGDKAAAALRYKGKQFMGAQRSNLVAQGIKIDSGTAAVVQENTRSAIEQDTMTIQNNAWREAWGFKVSALNQRTQGQIAAFTAENNARNTLLSGGLNALGYGAQAGYYWNGGTPKKAGV